MKSKWLVADQVARVSRIIAFRAALSGAGMCLAVFQTLGQTPADPGAPVQQPTQSAASAPAGAKKPGVIRIAIALPKTQLGQTNTATSRGEALRTTETEYLHGPSIEVVPLSAMLPSQMAAEAKEKQCDYILYSSLTEKAGSSGGGFLKKAMPFASMIPMAGALGGVAGSIASTAASVAVTGAAGLAGDVKAKSEMTFNYKLVAVGDPAETAKVSASLKAKAKQDGEDIISPLVEQAATVIVGHVAKSS